MKRWVVLLIGCAPLLLVLLSIAAGAPPIAAGAPPIAAGAPPIAAGAPSTDAGAPALDEEKPDLATLREERNKRIERFFGYCGSDRDVVPMVRVEPQYPMSAKQRGVEGWVELMFTITKAGTVTDIVVTASNPGTIFNKSAVQAVSKWKYNPKVENGTAVDRPGVRQRIKFELPR